MCNIRIYSFKIILIYHVVKYVLVECSGSCYELYTCILKMNDSTLNYFNNVL